MLSNFEQIGVQFGRTQVFVGFQKHRFFQEVFDMVDREADGSDSLVESLATLVSVQICFCVLKS